MADQYKALHFNLDFPCDDKVLNIVNDLLAKQPDPRPFVEPNSEGYVFHFHTLDVRLLRRDVEELERQDLFASGRSVEYQKAGAILRILFDEVSKIGSYGIKSGKRQYVGFNTERKVRDRKVKEQHRAQYYYAQNNSFSRASNPLPPDLTNQIICGDSLEVLRRFPDNSIDLILTSPPYNFGLEYDNQEDAHRWEHYFEKLFAIFDECIRVLKYGGRIAVNVQPLFSDYIPSHHMISNFFINRKMIWKGEILWEKNNYNCKYTAWGSWKSPSNPYLIYMGVH